MTTPSPSCSPPSIGTPARTPPIPTRPIRTPANPEPIDPQVREQRWKAALTAYGKRREAHRAAHRHSPYDDDHDGKTLARQHTAHIVPPARSSTQPTHHKDRTHDHTAVAPAARPR
ncbi:hypothetical protein AB0K00_40235 [Dactylosporangium sp. NPDC049525]|uniref:hypothetical protein n=1 Tax=Dactylosporangium sp. NPDC049525 TaxID=3154730 RepID=UPI003430EA5D